MNTFNQENETVKVLLESLKKECNLKGYPMFATVAIDDDGSETSYITHVLSPAVSGKELSNDRFSGLLNVMSGFDTVPHREITELNLGEIYEDIEDPEEI